MKRQQTSSFNAYFYLTTTGTTDVGLAGEVLAHPAFFERNKIFQYCSEKRLNHNEWLFNTVLK